MEIFTGARGRTGARHRSGLSGGFGAGYLRRQESRFGRGLCGYIYSHGKSV